MWRRIQAVNVVLSLTLAGCSIPPHGAATTRRWAAESAPLWHVADPEAARRLEAVSAEIEASAPHAWAGRYVLGDKPSSDRIALAPREGFVLISGKSGSCCKEADGGKACGPDCPGSREAVFGDVVVTPQGRLRLALELTPGSIISAGEFVPIDLGGRHYLIASDEMDAFNEAVRNGDEPRHSAQGRFFLREGEDQVAMRLDRFEQIRFDDAVGWILRHACGTEAERMIRKELGRLPAARQHELLLVGGVSAGEAPIQALVSGYVVLADKPCVHHADRHSTVAGLAAAQVEATP